MTRKRDPSPPEWPIGKRPGFLIRRLHQIHVALFAEHCARFDITPVQYSLLSALSHKGTADQTTLAAEIALDRTTATGALRRLEARGLIVRIRSEEDKRARECRLTRAGADLLARMEDDARTAHHATLAPLSKADQRDLLRLMGRLVTMHGEMAMDAKAAT